MYGTKRCAPKRKKWIRPMLPSQVSAVTSPPVRLSASS